MGVYAEGFMGIFTGFFKIIDTYIIGALNDSGHLSVIVFSTIIGGIVALISKNGGIARNCQRELLASRTQPETDSWQLGF